MRASHTLFYSFTSQGAVLHTVSWPAAAGLGASSRICYKRRRGEASRLRLPPAKRLSILPPKNIQPLWAENYIEKMFIEGQVCFTLFHSVQPWPYGTRCILLLEIGTMLEPLYPNNQRTLRACKLRYLYSPPLQSVNCIARPAGL